MKNNLEGGGLLRAINQPTKSSKNPTCSAVGCCSKLHHPALKTTKVSQLYVNKEDSVHDKRIREFRWAAIRIESDQSESAIGHQINARLVNS